MSIPHDLEASRGRFPNRRSLSSEAPQKAPPTYCRTTSFDASMFGFCVPQLHVIAINPPTVCLHLKRSQCACAELKPDPLEEGTEDT